MGWEAASWLMDTSALEQLFRAPVPASPESPRDGFQCDDDATYEDYLDDWIRRVEAGQLDGMDATA